MCSQQVHRVPPYHPPLACGRAHQDRRVPRCKTTVLLCVCLAVGIRAHGAALEPALLLWGVQCVCGRLLMLTYSHALPPSPVLQVGVPSIPCSPLRLCLLHGAHPCSRQMRRRTCGQQRCRPGGQSCGRATFTQHHRRRSCTRRARSPRQWAHLPSTPPGSRQTCSGAGSSSRPDSSRGRSRPGSSGGRSRQRQRQRQRLLQRPRCGKAWRRRRLSQVATWRWWTQATHSRFGAAGKQHDQVAARHPQPLAGHGHGVGGGGASPAACRIGLPRPSRLEARPETRRQVEAHLLKGFC